MSSTATSNESITVPEEVLGTALISGPSKGLGDTLGSGAITTIWVSI
jgi:hypothetical protein